MGVISILSSPQYLLFSKDITLSDQSQAAYQSEGGGAYTLDTSSLK